MYISVSSLFQSPGIGCSYYIAHATMKTFQRSIQAAKQIARQCQIRCNRPVQSFSRCTSPGNRTRGSRELRCLHACPSPPSVSAQLCDSPAAENHNKSYAEKTYRRLKLNFMVSQGQMIKHQGSTSPLLLYCEQC